MNPWILQPSFYTCLAFYICLVAFYVYFNLDTTAILYLSVDSLLRVSGADFEDTRLETYYFIRVHPVCKISEKKYYILQIGTGEHI